MTEPSEESSAAPATTDKKYKILIYPYEPTYVDYDSPKGNYEISLHELSLSYPYASSANQIRTEHTLTKWGARRRTKGILKRYLKSLEPGFFEEYDA